MIGDLFAGFFFIAIVYLLVKPGAGGATAVTAFGAALSSLIQGAIAPTTREESAPLEDGSIDGNIDITNEQFGG